MKLAVGLRSTQVPNYTSERNRDILFELVTIRKRESDGQSGEIVEIVERWWE